MADGVPSHLWGGSKSEKYPAWDLHTKSDIENCPFIVDFPINSMVMFHSYVNVYQRMTGWWCNNQLEKYESHWEGLSHILWKTKKNETTKLIDMSGWLDITSRWLASWLRK